MTIYSPESRMPPYGRLPRDPEKLRRRRNRVILAGTVGMLVLLCGGLFGWVMLKPVPASTFASPAAVTNDGGDRAGITAGGSGPTTVDIYLDFGCAACRDTVRGLAPATDKLVADNKIRLVWHPLGSPGDDPPSTMKPAGRATGSTVSYLTRSANAAACAADAGKLQQYGAVLFANIPPNPTAGLTDDELIDIAGPVGLNAPSFAQCTRGLKYRDWVDNVTDQAEQRGLGRPPVVLVNGAPLAQLTPQALTAAVQ